MEHESTPALRAIRVTKRFGDVVALDEVSLDVKAGECVALVGESGSGKTTLLRCFNRMVEPESGRIQVDGDDVASLDAITLRRRIGYVQQEGGLLPHWRVLRNTALVPWLRRAPDAERLAATSLEMVGLSAQVFADRWPRELSGGQRQRVALARALADRPAFLLLDEPFGALDAITRAEVQETFVALRTEIRVSALLVTHDLHEAARLADRIAVLRAGRLEQIGRVADLVDTPATDYVRRLLEKARLDLAS
ncbi:MAG: ATP-binding cassette domain-containing protein [Gemmatimonas sp.]|nr:ATP-binding cassette domain-containing protein [Gemmatimonas sp.]